MQTLILLIVVFIAGLAFNKEKSTHSRIVIGSFFGVIFFAIWPFIVFYGEIYHLDKKQLLYIFATVSALTILITLFLVRLKYQKITASILFVFFITLTIISMSYTHEIKNKISIYAGFFDQKYAAKYKIKNTTSRKTVTLHNYRISLDKHWKKMTDKGELFEYYILTKNQAKIAELRPQCFKINKISLPEIVKTTEENQRNKVNTFCYQPDRFSYACKINLLDKEEKLKRIRWYSFNNNDEGIELDFVLYKNTLPPLNEIEQIILSARSIKSNSTTDKICLGLMEWM